jgi:hypothetical protein
VGAIAAGIYLKNKYQRPTDYRALFIIGLVWIALGASGDNYSFLIFGIVFMIIGGRNKKKWEENRFRWSNLSNEEKRIKIIFLSMIALIIGVSIVYFLF